MKRLALLLVLTLGLPLAAPADQASRRAKAQGETGSNRAPEQQARLADFERQTAQLQQASPATSPAPPAASPAPTSSTLK
jgi:hypothetical protein